MEGPTSALILMHLNGSFVANRIEQSLLIDSVEARDVFLDETGPVEAISSWTRRQKLHLPRLVCLDDLLEELFLQVKVPRGQLEL